MDKKIDEKIIRSRRRRTALRVIIILAAVAGAFTLLLTMLGKGIARDSLTIATVDCGDMETTVPATGRVVPAYEQVINSPFTTRLLALHATPGDSVRAGDPLLQLDLEAEQINYEKMVDRRRVSRQEMTRDRLQSRTTLSDLAMQISVKEMEVSQCLIEVDNERRLDSLGSGTGDRIRAAETALRTARLQLEQLHRRLENEQLRSQAAEEVQALNVSTIDKDLSVMRSTLQRGRVTAPVDGILTFLVSEIGSQISAGQKVAVVSDLTSFRIRGEIAEGASERMAVGSRVLIRIGRSELTGAVTNITPQSRGGVVEFMVNADDPRHPRLRSGVRAELYISYGFRDSAIRIPMGQYYKGTGEYYLFVVTGDDRLERRRVSLGESNRSHVEVLSGLTPGERVVISDMSAYENSSSLRLK